MWPHLKVGFILNCEQASFLCYFIITLTDVCGVAFKLSVDLVTFSSKVIFKSYLEAASTAFRNLENT